MNIFLARHGEDEDNRDDVFNGLRDTHLTPFGLAQATDLGRRIRNEHAVFDAIYSSPLSRAYETARVVSAEADLPAPRILEALSERDVGILTGMKVAEAHARYGSQGVSINGRVYFDQLEGGESFSDLMNRAGSLLAFLEERHPDGTILLVSHRMILTSVFASYNGISLPEGVENFYLKNAELFQLAPK